MSGETKTRIASIEAPYRRAIWLDDMRFESGMRLMRVTIKEGGRITQLDLDAATAARFGKDLLDWANSAADGQPA
ncbi:MAG: hypothetical protein HY056_05850 [Proteobacteria bacterium]|nr:hypothetical protein [Pseudomonadota bacterium]